MKLPDNALLIFLFICCLLTGSKTADAQNEKMRTEVIQPVILVSDLMRPYDDPDDHWDLAHAFALAYTGAIDLKGVVIDSPVNDAYVDDKNPDVAAVALLNYLTGLHIPVAIGSPYPLKTKNDKQEYALIQDMGGVNLIRHVLLESETKVKIIITGSARNVAIALNRFPYLFENKCSGIYLNAGHGLDNPFERSRTEWNTKLDMYSYHAMFDAPCPVFWLPINVSHYRLKYDKVFPELSENMKKFFTFMYDKQPAGNWFQFLQKPLNDSTINSLSDQYKSMFCAVSFFHAAGYLIDSNGNLVSVSDGKETSPVAGFTPVNVDMIKYGYVKYNLDEGPSNIMLLQNEVDKSVYEKQTGNALKNILKLLP